MNTNNKKLAINGGKPVSKKPILIHKPYIDRHDHNSVLKSLKSTFVSGDGPECRIFEKKISKYLNVRHSLFVNSATSALELAFRVKILRGVLRLSFLILPIHLVHWALYIII